MSDVASTNETTKTHTYIHIYFIYIYIYIYIYKVEMSFQLNQNISEWLMQQHHRVGGMTGGPTERIDTVHQEFC